MKIKRKVWISTLLFVGAASLMAFLSSILIGDEKILMNVSAASTTDLDGKTVLLFRYRLEQSGIIRKEG